MIMISYSPLTIFHTHTKNLFVFVLYDFISPMSRAYSNNSFICPSNIGIVKERTFFFVFVSKHVSFLAVEYIIFSIKIRRNES